jgi:hypothetical protein
MIENINALQPYLTVFPDATDVFAEPVEKYARLVNPYLSIDLSAVNPAWTGKIHLVSPVEPIDGMLGELTTSTHNDYLKTNWIAFKLNAENRYELLGDFSYFAHENSSVKQSSKNLQAEIDAHYVENKEGFAEAKAKYAKYGALYGDYGGETLEEKQAYFDEPYNYLDQLGGPIGWGNWTSYCEDFNIKLNTGYYMDDEAEDDVYPISSTGNRFYFIACVPGYHFITKGYSEADAIILFYEPIERIVWITFDYT